MFALCMFRAKKKGMWQQSWTSYVSPSQYKKNLKMSQESLSNSPVKASAKWAFWR